MRVSSLRSKRMLYPRSYSGEVFRQELGSLLMNSSRSKCSRFDHQPIFLAGRVYPNRRGSGRFGTLRPSTWPYDATALSSPKGRLSTGKLLWGRLLYTLEIHFLSVRQNFIPLASNVDNLHIRRRPITVSSLRNSCPMPSRYGLRRTRSPAERASPRCTSPAALRGMRVYAEGNGDAARAPA